jgi:hypothetical protein
MPLVRSGVIICHFVVIASIVAKATSFIVTADRYSGKDIKGDSFL